MQWILKLFNKVNSNQRFTNDINFIFRLILIEFMIERL